MSDRVAGAVEDVIRMLAVGVDRLLVDLGRGAIFIAARHAGDATHVAILARDSFLASRRRAVLLPHDFELDAGIDRHLMA